MSLSRRQIRSLLAIFCAAMSLLGWGLIGTGRFAVAAVLEREHCVEVSLDEGHLDLRLGHHERFADGDDDERSSAPGHVIHLCAPSEWLPSSSPSAPAVTLGLPVVGARAIADPTADARARFARVTMRIDRSPPRSLPLLL